jgi:small redox-active disulfide protein 2
MEIKILGSGCMNCKKLYANAEAAVQELGANIQITKVEDFKEITKYGVMRTPAIVIDEKVKAFGKISTVEEIKKFIQE